MLRLDLVRSTPGQDDTVAETVGRSAPACRQLASRARQKIAAGPGSARFGIVSAEHRLVTDKFIAACSNGDLNSLLEVLAPDDALLLGTDLVKPRQVLMDAYDDPTRVTAAFNLNLLGRINRASPQFINSNDGS